MGLLAKAISVRIIPPKNGGLLQRLLLFAGNTASDNRPASGLLQKSLVLLGSTDSFSTAGDGYTGPGIAVLMDFSGSTEKLVRRIEELPRDFSFPYQVFLLLQNELRMEQGALFLYSHMHDDFRPWIQTGMETGLVSDLSFLRVSWDRIKTGSNDRPVMLSGEGKFFPSVKTASLFKRMPVLLPITHEGELRAGIIFSSPAMQKKNMTRFVDMAGRISWKIGQALHKGREAPLACISTQKQYFSTASDAIAQLQAGIGDSGAQLFFIRLSLEPLYRVIRQKYSGAITVRLRDDMLEVINSLLLFNGVSFPLHETELLVIVNSYGMFSPELLEFHLHRYFKHFFHGVFDHVAKPLPGRTLVYPACGKTIPQILAEL